ncbi:MAG: tyrosine recombinase XerC [Alcaligenaceae bacterium]|nr:tyrosine recombinase XerC [Alcaligenaceae bacterium]
MSNPLPAAMEQWLAHLHTHQRYAAHTLAAYRRDLSQLVRLCPGLAPADITNQHIRTAIARLHAQQVSPRSLARTLSAWRSFYHWWVPMAGLALNPAKDVKTPKAPKSLPKALSVEQTQALLDYPAKELHTSPVQLRDQAMFELFYSSGLRLTELIQLDLHYIKENGYESAGWLNLQDNELTVRGKGNKSRTVPLGKKAHEALLRWLEARPSLLKPATPEHDKMALFLGEQGARISPRVVQLQLKKYALQSDIPGQIHPHVLRHSFASHMLQSAQDLRAVQELLGHANISTTQIYTRLDFQHLAKAYDQAHPRAKRKN